MRILIVEDDLRLADLVARGLGEDGHVVDVENDGESGALAGSSGTYDVVVLDVMLPRLDGFAVARRLRREGVSTPILMLTARDTVEDTVAGLDAGADDYLRKPFAFSELNARLRALTRREAAPVRTVLCVGDIEMDAATRRVKRGSRELALTARELAFLEYLMRNPGVVLTRTMLEDALWERDRDTSSNLIEVYIARLRSKLTAAGEPSPIETVRGIGYRFGPAGAGA
jgi:two-component system OmpR family response regulator